MKCFNFLLCAAVLLGCGTQKQTVQNNNAKAVFPQFSKEGHRGSRGLMPENTIPAMQKAIDLGVTTLEMDVVISKDNKVVVSHDTYFHADITTTPDGRTITKEESAKLLLYTMPYDSIKKYDVGMKPHPGFPQQQKMAVHKPLLSDLLQASEAYAAKKGVAPLWYNIETKTKKGGDGKAHPAPRPFVDLLVSVVQKAGVAERTVIQSFDMRTLQVAHRKYPQFKLSLLIDANNKQTLDQQLQELGFVPFIYSPHHTIVTPDLIKQCHEKGMKIVPWTVNDKAGIERIKAMGVDGIITDYPDLFEQLEL